MEYLIKKAVEFIDANAPMIWGLHEGLGIRAESPIKVRQQRAAWGRRGSTPADAAAVDLAMMFSAQWYGEFIAHFLRACPSCPQCALCSYLVDSRFQRI